MGRRGLAMVVAMTLVAAGSVLTMGSAGATAVRYRDRVFTDVDVTKDVVYRPAGFDGGNTALALDVYEPHGDAATARPLVVWMHGYGPASDDKASPLDVEIIRRFVLHGAVVASFNYRVSATQTLAVIIQDPLAAVAWLRAHAATYRIDVTRVAFAGISAGAYRTMHAAYDLDITKGQPPAESRVQAVLSFSGNGPTDTFQPGEPPLFMAHGELDTDAPYAAAVATCNGANAGGVPCEMHAYADADHIGLFKYADQLESLASAWLYKVLDLAHAQDPPLPTTAVATSSTAPTTRIPPVTSPARPAQAVPGPVRFTGQLETRKLLPTEHENARLPHFGSSRIAEKPAPGT